MNVNVKVLDAKIVSAEIEAVLGVDRQTRLKWLKERAEECQIRPRQQHYEQVQIDE